MKLLGDAMELKKKNHHQQLSRNLPQQTIVKVGRRFSNQGNRGENRKYFNQGNFKTNKQHLAANKKKYFKKQEMGKNKRHATVIKGHTEGKTIQKEDLASAKQCRIT